MKFLFATHVASLLIGCTTTKTVSGILDPQPVNRQGAGARLVLSNERAKMPKETTHRDAEKRTARIERRAKKRAETVMRKKLVKMRKNGAITQDR